MTAAEKRIGRFTVIYYSPVQDPVALLRALAGAPLIPGKGRGGIKVIGFEDHKLAVRKYTHGGLFRVFTGDRFLSRRRAITEAETTNHLREAGFPAVRPYGVVVERRVLAFRLHLITFFEEGAVDLIQRIRTSPPKQRLRIARELGESFWRLERAGVFHPDLHLRNVLVTVAGRLVFLDLDRACKKAVGRKDIEWMFRRLGRFVDKMKRRGDLSVTPREKAVFLRAYARLSGYDPTDDLIRSAARDGLRHRIGWLLESLLYGKR
jgi:3-deoxy-D-manno-octulosonic acid kinase